MTPVSEAMPAGGGERSPAQKGLKPALNLQPTEKTG